MSTPRKKSLQDPTSPGYYARNRTAVRKQLSKQILDGIPTGVWADYWATLQEEKGHSFSGMDIMDVAPKPPAWARQWAREIAESLLKLNGVHDLEALYEKATELGYTRDRSHFGYHLGMQSVGHGVGWSDDAKSGRHEDIRLPLREFYR